MLCDACLMLLYRGFKDNETVIKVFFALQVDDFPTIKTLAKESGLSAHRVRDALSSLRGTGLIWGSSCPGLSDSGHRLMDLLRDADQPEPAGALCDDCLLEIGQELAGDVYAVLAQLADRMTHSRHDLVMSTGITGARMRDILRILEGAQLVQASRGRFFRLSAIGRRFERLLKSQISNIQHPTSNIQHHRRAFSRRVPGSLLAPGQPVPGRPMGRL